MSWKQPTYLREVSTAHLAELSNYEYVIETGFSKWTMRATFEVIGAVLLNKKLLVLVTLRRGGVAMDVSKVLLGEVLVCLTLLTEEFYFIFMVPCIVTTCILIRSNKMQQYAGIYLLQNFSICFGCPSHPSSGVHQTVTAASGTGHITCVLHALQNATLSHSAEHATHTG